MQQLVKKSTLSPKQLFLIDGCGALLTASLLFAVLRTFNDYIGMPATTLTLLSMIATTFSVYSFCCSFLVNNNWRPFLRSISIANLLYCCLILGLVIYNYSQVTILGITYFLVEILIICVLVFFEIKALNAND